jgi:hypothetical protein
MSLRAAAVAAALGVGSGGATAAVIPRGDGLDPMRETAALALEVGLTPEQAVTATAIATGESGHRDEAVGDVALEDGTWGPSLGRWQVRCIWAQVGTGGTRDCDVLNDPHKNAQSMYEISSGGTNWRPWSVYLHGTYQAYLADARRAVEDVSGNPSSFAPLADGRQPATPAPAPTVDRSPKVFAMNLWRLTVGGWLSLGRSENPAVRDAWSKADAELFKAPPQ